jgi:hypothetical protein
MAVEAPQTKALLIQVVCRTSLYTSLHKLARPMYTRPSYMWIHRRESYIPHSNSNVAAVHYYKMSHTNEVPSSNEVRQTTVLQLGPMALTWELHLGLLVRTWELQLESMALTWELQMDSRMIQMGHW